MFHAVSTNYIIVELDSTHIRGRLGDNWNHRNNQQSMTIGDQSMPMFHDEVTHRIHLASIGHPGSTILGSVRYLSLMRLSPFTSLDQANNPCNTVRAMRGYL